MITIRCLQRDWKIALVELICSAQSELVVTAPFITSDGTELVQSHLSLAMRERGRLQLITDLSPAHVCDGSLDPEAISLLAHRHPRFVLWHVPALHAKVYVADDSRAIVTSGNLTASAFSRNIEYGVEITDSRVVRQIRLDIADYQSIGVSVPSDAMDRYAHIARRVRETFVRQNSKIDIALRRAFNDAKRTAEVELVRLRLSGGAMHTVFAKTIELLLARRGPLPTVAIHTLVKQLHPDLCDDSVDRIIDGKRFGKKWKHAVRTAQQQLKKRGKIDFDGEVWQSIANSE